MKSKNLLRLKQVLARFPVSKSHWYSGIAQGKYPRPIKAYGNMSMWQESDIDKLLDAATNDEDVCL